MGSKPTPSFEEVSTSKNLSQLIRSNAPEYWDYMKSADLRLLEPYLRYLGAVAGDPHLGNFGPIPVTTNSGERQMQFVDIDFDDAGVAPFALDYVRYIAAIKAQCQEMRTRPLLKAYLLGLTGKKIKPPRQVRALMRMSVDAYDAMADKYTTKNTFNKKFKHKTGSIEPYRGKIKHASIAKLFPAETLLDIAHRIEDRGGSADETRIWALVQAANTRIRIMEIKGYALPGTASYGSQPHVDKWLSDIRQAFWPELTGAEYNLITLDGVRYWIREKRVSLINVPYSSQKKEEIDFVIALAIYDANVIGLAHGRQADSADYAAAIHKNVAKFHKATKKVMRDYLDSAKRVMKKKPAPAETQA
jgi:Uncharacterized protein conserved in bacteria (DUF2252)